MLIFPSRHLLLCKNSRDTHLAARCQTRFKSRFRLGAASNFTRDETNLLQNALLFICSDAEEADDGVWAAWRHRSARHRRRAWAKHPRRHRLQPPPQTLHATIPRRQLCCARRQRALPVFAVAAPGEFYFWAHSLAKIRSSRQGLAFFCGRARLTITFIHTMSGAVLHPMYVRACASTCFHWNAARRRLLFGGARGGKFIRAICHFDWHQARHIRRILIFAAAADENIAEMQTRRRVVKFAPEWWILKSLFRVCHILNTSRAIF